MLWLHNLIDQAKYCVLDLAVLVLSCISIAQIVKNEVERLRDASKQSQARGPTPHPQRNPPPRRHGTHKKPSNIR